MTLLNQDEANMENIVENNEAPTLEEQQIVLEAEEEKQTVRPVRNDRKAGRASKIKGAFSELKKVSWPSFNKVVKQTLVVLSVTAVFLLVVMGIDQLLYFLYNLLTKGMGA